MSNSTSIVPLVLWGQKPPTHTISILTCTYDQKTIISGSAEGQIGLWDVRHVRDGGLKVIPRSLIFAHGCKVVDIACALDASYDRPNIVSLAENGELCLWDMEDGLCLQLNVIPGTHSGLYSLQVPRGSLKEWRLACYGLYSEVYVLDTSTLQILYTLKSKISPNWITAVCTLRPARKKEDILCGLTISSQLKIWPIRSTNEIKNDVIFEQESKQLDCMKAKSMCANQFTQRTVLIISAKAWQIYDASDFSFLAAMPSPHLQPLVNGSFVAANRVLVWDKTGRAFLYKLPSRYLLDVEGSEPVVDKSTRAPILVCEFERSLGNPCDNPMYFSYGRRGPFYKLLLQGSKGRVSVWKIPDSDQADVSLCKENVSVALPVRAAEVTFADEGIKKTVLMEEQSMKVVPLVAQASFKDLWLAHQPIGLLDGLEEERGLIIAVTSSLYLASQGRIVCGRVDGSIVIISAIRAALAQLLQPNNYTKTGWPPYLVVYGHSGRVTCLLYPHDENPRYDVSLLLSGGSDFTVRVWDLFKGTAVHTFTPHGGEVVRLMVTPHDCNTRFLSCICSVAQDHSVALVGLRERKVVLLASRHTFPVETIRWRPKDDFMVVGCADGTVYVWQMETGHLDRCVAGSLAFDILESCHEETSAPTPALREHHRKFRLHHHLSTVAHLPIELRTPAFVKKVKHRITSLHHSVTGHKHATAQANAESKQLPGVIPPMRVCALRCCFTDPDVHVILLDPEALICQLLNEEADYFAATDSPVNPKRHLRRSAEDAPSAKPKESALGQLTYEIAQLLLSCCHGWGLDPTLDDTCVKKLGMLKPVKPLSFGLLTRGRLSLMLPGWYISGQEDNIAGALEAGQALDPDDLCDMDESEVQKIQYNAHWQLSSSLTTQHLVSIVAVTNTLMSMNYVSFIADKIGVGPSSDPASQPGVIRAEVKAGWSLLAALHCCLLPDAMKGFKYRPPLLHILARRWQDRCLEIREAAQAILLAELRRIGATGRKQLIDAWAPHLPQDLDSTDFGFEDLEPYMNNDEADKPAAPAADEDRSDIAMVMMTTRKMVSSDVRLRYATAIVMLGVIGAEFQKEVDPVNRDPKTQGEECAMDVNIVRNTAKALTTLLLQRQSSKIPIYSAIRRAAIDLIGRGFSLWEPHIDVSQVLIGLLELCADIESRIRSDKPRNFPMSAAMDLYRSAKHSLSLIATGRPSACITTLAKEVARHVASTNSMSFTQPSPAAIAVYSHVRHQLPQSGDTQFSSVMLHTRSEILRIIELMIEKNQQEVMDFIVEVVDIVVHMLDYKSMKEKGLTEVFPALFKFTMVAYCSNTRRLAVGARLGHIALYELRSSRCQLIPAHDSSISALAFSPEGKVLASFSYKDAKISFWQTSTSLLGMLSSTIKCVHSYNVQLPANPQASKSVRILWTSKKQVVLVLGDGSQLKFSI